MTNRAGRDTQPLPLNWRQSYNTTTIDQGASPALRAEIRRMAKCVTEPMPMFGGDEVRS